MMVCVRANGKKIKKLLSKTIKFHFFEVISDEYNIII